MKSTRPSLATAVEHKTAPGRGSSGHAIAKEAMTVSQLARAAGLSRSAVLYYESIGLLRAAKRSAGNYRQYGEGDAYRLQQIRSYRTAGLTLEDIGKLFEQPGTAFAAILKHRFAHLDAEIERLREQQRSIARLLRNSGAVKRRSIMTKQKWVEVMVASGFSEDDMHRWHGQFEKSAPEEHEEFLNFLHIPAEEVREIRAWSRKQSQPG